MKTRDLLSSAKLRARIKDPEGREGGLGTRLMHMHARMHNISPGRDCEEDLKMLLLHGLCIASRFEYEQLELKAADEILTQWGGPRYEKTEAKARASASLDSFANAGVNFLWQKPHGRKLAQVASLAMLEAAVGLLKAYDVKAEDFTAWFDSRELQAA